MRGLSTIPRQATRERCSAARRGRGAAARHVAVDLTPQAVEEVAARVAQLLVERDMQRTPECMTAGELAHELRVERPWVSPPQAARRVADRRRAEGAVAV